MARLDVGPNSSAVRYLDESAAAMEQARKLTGQLLTFSKGGNPVLETISISDLILDTCNFVLSGSAIKCEYDLPDDLWKVVVDQGRIWQVLSNILTNAREAMPEGGGVRVTVENVVIAGDSPLGLPPGGYIRIAVVDQGVGISKADLHRVFDPYFSNKARGGMGGREIVEKLRKIDSRVTAVVTSGYADDPEIANCREYGFTAALVKPYNIKTLRDLIAGLA